MQIPKGIHISTTQRRYKDKVYRANLLRRSYRKGGKVKTETLANLTHLGDDLVELLRQALRGEPVGVLNSQFEIVRSQEHGNVKLVLAAMQRLGMAGLVSTRACPERTLVLAMVAARVLAPASKLATANWFGDTTLLAELGLEAVTEDDLYGAMDWLVEQQVTIEKRLARRHLRKDGLVLYDLSSTYVEGIAARWRPAATTGTARRARSRSTSASSPMTPATGCAIAQMCPCAGPRGQTTAWKNHGEYTSCVQKTVESYYKKGLITEKIRETLKSAAGQSSCGKTGKKQCDKSKEDKELDRSEDDKLEKCEH